MTYDPNLQQRPVGSDPLTAPTAPVKSGSGGFLIAGILIAALVIGGYYYLNSGRSDMSTPTPPAQTTTAPEPAKPEAPAAMAPAAPAPAETAPAPTATPAPATPATPAPAQ
jgi:hypothetical protein